MKRFLVPLLLAATPAVAEYDSETRAYIEANTLGIFYHEMGHALIDILGLPIFGQEEDAADVLSVFMIDGFYDEEAAVSLAYDTAFGFQAEAEDMGEPAYWDVHGPDLQRYYNLVCLFYGANPDERDDVAEDLGLPEERADYCPEEYDQAAGSWGAVLDELVAAGPGRSFRLKDVSDGSEDAVLAHEVLSAEVAALNGEMSLPQTLEIRVAYCDEANAFYDPADQSITYCVEFVRHLAAQANW
ncbi:DUF4344 domain-containing metallopeptidase [Algirhabdus cladophorae]|uniref:DUF4344 domain-containing metallopeptidase n=1 Tax=Algirhabdus cladophorae TaxID=3377108 RepID=UPI003B847736